MEIPRARRMSAFTEPKSGTDHVLVDGLVQEKRGLSLISQ
jgi:hypothetical protein